MSGKRKLKAQNSKIVVFNSFASYTLCLTLVAGILLLGGCGLFEQRSEVGKPDELQVIPTEEKRAELLRQIDRKFDNPNAHFQLGQLYQAQGRLAQAEHQYSIALSFDPVHRQAQASRVKVLLDNGNTGKAQLLAGEYLRQASNSASSSLNLAQAFQKQQLDEYALVCYNQALNLAPNSAKIHKHIGYYYLSRNDKVQAKEFLIRSFQLDRSQPDVAGELGRLGVMIEIPRKTAKKTSRLDRIVEESEKETK